MLHVIQSFVYKRHLKTRLMHSEVNSTVWLVWHEHTWPNKSNWNHGNKREVFLTFFFSFHSFTCAGKGFVPVDSCLSLLNCMRDVETTWRQCFQSDLAHGDGDRELKRANRAVTVGKFKAWSSWNSHHSLMLFTSQLFHQTWLVPLHIALQFSGCRHSKRLILYP